MIIALHCIKCTHIYYYYDQVHYDIRFFIYIGIGPFEVDTHTYFEHIGISIYIMIIKNRYENVSFNSFIDIIIIIKRRLILNRYNDRHFVYIYIVYI